MFDPGLCGRMGGGNMRGDTRDAPDLPARPTSRGFRTTNAALDGRGLRGRALNERKKEGEQ